jgi:hypothetical protein
MAEDLSRPAFRYPSSGRRPERLNQSRNVNAPLQLLRGWAAGTLGLPGDIEGLVRMLPGIQNETPVLPTSDFYREWLPGYDERPAARAMSGLGALTGGMGATNVARAGLGAVKRATDVNAIRDYVRSAQGVSGLPGTAVIKPKGGNWLAGAQSPEASVQRLKRAELSMPTPEDLAGVADDPRVFAEIERRSSGAALNKWIDKKLAGYIRNEMATPEDPVRALAERGVLHVDPGDLNFRVEQHGKYMQPGQTAVAQSLPAKAWEGASDLTVFPRPAAEVARVEEVLGREVPDWLKKAPPETRVYSFNDMSPSDLGFPHLIDELRNAVNPESGLPRELLWKYSDLDKVTVPQAVQRVSDINAWRAAQKAEADAARAMNPATQVFKEYPEQGYKWVELKQPAFEPFTLDTLPERFKVEGGKLPSGLGVYEVRDTQAPIIQNTGGVGETPEEAVAAFNEWFKKNRADSSTLADALKYEGETMGHCVGGYCPDVVEGLSRIFSLRDAKGQPHVTVEVKPDTTPPRHDHIIDEIKRVVGSNNIPDDDAYDALYKQAMASVMANRPQDIIQIKGKANRAPKEDYLPFVQDFVRSGQWGRVGDLGNTGLVRLGDTYVTRQRYKDIAGDLNPEYFENLLRNRVADLSEDDARILRQLQEPENPGFARGGAVTAPPGPAQYDPARIDALAAELMAA